MSGQSRFQNRSRSRRRRAMLLMSALVCLSVAMLLFVNWMKTAALERQQLRAQQDRIQVEYLAESGVRRAVAQLAEDPAYTGEIWRITKELLSARSGATVTIQVEASADNQEIRKLKVVADFPDEGTSRARRSRELTLDLKKLGESQ